MAKLPPINENIPCYNFEPPPPSEIVEMFGADFYFDADGAKVNAPESRRFIEAEVSGGVALAIFWMDGEFDDWAAGPQDDFNVVKIGGIPVRVDDLEKQVVYSPPNGPIEKGTLVDVRRGAVVVLFGEEVDIVPPKYLSFVVPELST